MINSHYLILATLAMALVTFLTRAMPVLIPKKILDTPWLRRLNESLPLAVLVLLILTSLSFQGLTADTHIYSPQLHLLLAQIGALVVVLVTYHISRQLLISMVAGIAAINGFMWLADMMLV